MKNDSESKDLRSRVSSKDSNNRAVKIFLFSSTAIIALLIGFMFFLLSANSVEKEKISDNVKEVNGKQVISITAKGGFSPNYVVAKSKKDTLLHIKTENTFDCTSALVIPKLNFNKLLPASGETEIEIPAQEEDAEIFGTCNVGLYHFTLKFV